MRAVVNHLTAVIVMTQFPCVIAGICVVTGNECLIPWQHPHQPCNDKQIHFEFKLFKLLTAFIHSFYQPAFIMKIAAQVKEDV